MIKLIVSDLDGTLLRNSGKEISKENVDAINCAKDNNIRFTFASGRIYCVMEKWYKNLCGNTPVISCNGAYIRNENKIFVNEKIHKDVICDLINLYDKYPVKKAIYSENRIFCTEDDIIESLIEKWQCGNTLPIPLYFLKDTKEIISATKESCQKILVWTENVSIRKEMFELGKAYNDYCDCVSAEALNLEFGKKGISKGSGIEFLADMYKFELSEVMAIGDNNNDISMLKNAGIGIAVGNATKEAKDAANFIVEDCEKNGVAQSITKYAL